MTTGPGELLIILVVVLLIFGPSKLPGLARSLGQAQRELRNGFREGATRPVSPSSPAHQRSAEPKEDPAVDDNGTAGVSDQHATPD